jgi:hypothetical protein
MKWLYTLTLIFSLYAEQDPASLFCGLYHVYGERSGGGSTLEQTKTISREIPSLLERYHCRSMLDLGCGDFVWMRHVSLPVEKYVGADVLDFLICSHQANFGNQQRSFICLDALTGEIPKVDLIFCRDFLVHYSNEHIFKILKKIKQSGSKYLLTTIFPDRPQESDRESGGWRPLNLTDAPFHLPPPLEIINEDCTQFISDILWNDKSLGLWEINQLP